MFDQPHDISHLRAEDKVALAHSVVEFLSGELSSVPELSPFPVLLSSLASQVEKHFDNQELTRLSDELTTSDQVRDDAQRSLIYYLVSLALRHDRPDVAAAARTIHEKAFPENLDYVQMGYDSESEIIGYILMKLDSDELKPYVKKTDLEPFVEFARQAEDEFKHIQSLQREYFKELRELETLKLSTHALEQSLQAVISMLRTIYPFKKPDVQESMQKIFDFILKASNKY